jgi:hypothetical protein
VVNWKLLVLVRKHEEKVNVHSFNFNITRNPFEVEKNVKYKSCRQFNSTLTIFHLIQDPTIGSAYIEQNMKACIVKFY